MMSLGWREPGIVPGRSGTARGVLVWWACWPWRPGRSVPAGPVQDVGAGGQALNHRAGPARPARPRPVGEAVRAEVFLIALAGADLDRSVAFCGDGSGWPAEGLVGPGVVRAAVGAGRGRSGVHRRPGPARCPRCGPAGRPSRTIAVLPGPARQERKGTADAVGPCGPAGFQIP